MTQQLELKRRWNRAVAQQLLDKIAELRQQHLVACEARYLELAELYHLVHVPGQPDGDAALAIRARMEQAQEAYLAQRRAVVEPASAGVWSSAHPHPRQRRRSGAKQ